MPESESKPKLIELIGPGTGQGWKAVLRNGKPAVVHEIPVPPAEATAAVPRLQRLFEHRHPALSPVLAWGTDPNGVWVAVEPNEGTPLSSILTRGPMSPPAAAALGAAVLSGVAALHETGIAMGGFGATAVRLTSNGHVTVAGHPAAAGRGPPSPAVPPPPHPTARCRPTLRCRRSLSLRSRLRSPRLQPRRPPWKRHRQRPWYQPGPKPLPAPLRRLRRRPSPTHRPPRRRSRPRSRS